ncbi:hypothetical protein D3C80_1258620 [compost metagenome]
MERPARHILYDLSQQLHIWIDHAVAIPITARCTIMDLPRIDQVKVAGAGLLCAAIDGGDLRAGFNRTNAECIVRMWGIFMREEGGTQTFHIPEPPVTPETRGFRCGKRHILKGLFLRNIVHSERIKQSVITVLNKSDRLEEMAI